MKPMKEYVTKTVIYAIVFFLVNVALDLVVDRIRSR